MSKIHKKKYYKIEFKLASPLVIGSGENNNTDKDIIRNGQGRPFIPGSALAGISRALFEENHVKYPFVSKKSQQADYYFGNIKDIEGNSKLVFYDAVLLDKKFHISYRDGVGLDDCKAAISGAKFDMEVLEPGVRFVTYIEQNFYEGDWSIIDEIVKEWQSETICLGAKTMRGYGAIKEVKIVSKEFDFASADDVEEWLSFDLYQWKEEGKCAAAEEAISKVLNLELKQMSGSFIRKYTTAVAKNEKEVMPDYEQLTQRSVDGKIPVIPGTSWAGVFHHRMKKIVTTFRDKDYFGDVEGLKSKKSIIKFNETKLEGAKDKMMTRTSINRFTGGVIEEALFTGRTYENGDTLLQISFDIVPEDDCKKALAATIADLHYGFISVGGLGAVGNGLFQIQTINGELVKDDVYKQVLEIMNHWEGERMASWNEFVEEAKMINGYVVASLTDEYIVDEWPMQHDSLEGKEDKLLEVRVFNKDKEIKLTRTDISKAFIMRVIEDDSEKNYYDEEQFLDIDTRKSKNLFLEQHRVVSTGGGQYYLPLEHMEDAKVCIRYYTEQYSETGQARIKDWRLVEFKEGK